MTTSTAAGAEAGNATTMMAERPRRVATWREDPYGPIRAARRATPELDDARRDAAQLHQRLDEAEQTISAIEHAIVMHDPVKFDNSRVVDRVAHLLRLYHHEGVRTW